MTCNNWTETDITEEQADRYKAMCSGTASIKDAMARACNAMGILKPSAAAVTDKHGATWSRVFTSLCMSEQHKGISTERLAVVAAIDVLRDPRLRTAESSVVSANAMSLTPELREQLLTAVLRCLNTALAADPGAMTALTTNRVPCSTVLADHPHVIVNTTRAGFYASVGMLGVLNGVLAAMGLPAVAIVQTDTDASDPISQFVEYAIPVRTELQTKAGER